MRLQRAVDGALAPRVSVPPVADAGDFGFVSGGLAGEGGAGARAWASGFGADALGRSDSVLDAAPVS